MTESSPTLPSSSESSRSRPALNRALSFLGPFLALAAVVLFFAITDGWMNGAKAAFLTTDNLTSLSRQTATVAVAALGMTIIIIAGGIDLSAGTAIALCATVLAWSLQEDVGLPIVRRWTPYKTPAQLNETRSELANARSRLSRAERQLESNRTEFGKAKAAPPAEVDQSKLQQLTDDATRLETEIADWLAEINRLDAGLAPVRIASVALGLLMAIGAGGLCGLLNGLLISYLHVVPFIVTLGTMQLYLGLAKKLAGETTVRPDRAQVPDGLADLLSARPETLWLGLPSGVWLLLLLAGALAAVLNWTVFSRYVFALGSNEATARLCGINVRWNKIAVYTLGGLFVGIAGAYLFSRLKVGDSSSGSGLELRVIAAVVIGGASLSGGRGSVLGTLLGALIMSVIANGCTMLGLENPVQDMILGVIIVAAVTLDQLRQRRML